MKSILRRMGLLTGSVLVSGLIGCGPDLSLTDGSTAPLASPGTQAAPLTVNPSTGAQLPSMGTPGTPFSDSCPAGSVGTGLNVRGSDRLEQVQLICRKLNLDGTLGATALTPARGGAGGTAATGSCASNQIMSGQLLGGEPTLRQVGALCSTATRLKNATGGSDSALGPLGLAGPSTTTACPAGHAITGLYGRTGVGAEQLGFKCTKLDDVKSIVTFGMGGGLALVADVSINGSIGPSTTVAAGQNIDLSLSNVINNVQGFCTNCRTQYQIVVAWVSSNPAVASQPLGCTFNASLDWGQSASAFTRVSLPAPTQPGTYTLRAIVDSLHSSCDPQEGWDLWSSAAGIIGEIQVN
ncbi:MAG: hypothetical protein EOO71_22745 [Myxococcaceae bacterium]|nr:MAG: hypothetical protein EOO71_22745 [Myxococcaceae bacterium]